MMPKTRTRSGYTLNKDGVHVVTHANIVTPHTAQNTKSLLNQRQNVTLC